MSLIQSCFSWNFTFMITACIIFERIFFIITRTKNTKTPALPSTTKNNFFGLVLSKLNGRFRLSSWCQGSRASLISCSHLLCSSKESQIVWLLTQNLPVVQSQKKPSPSSACGVLRALLQPCHWRHGLLLLPRLLSPARGPLRVPAHLRDRPCLRACVLVLPSTGSTFCWAGYSLASLRSLCKCPFLSQAFPHPPSSFKTLLLFFFIPRI